MTTPHARWEQDVIADLAAGDVRGSTATTDLLREDSLIGGDGVLDQEAAADMRANRRLRDTYAGKAYGLAASCIAIWTVLLAIQGVIKAMTGVDLWSDQVIIAVTTGVTVSVLAAFLGVIRGLFPNKDQEGARKV